MNFQTLFIDITIFFFWSYSLLTVISLVLCETKRIIHWNKTVNVWYDILLFHFIACCILFFMPTFWRHRPIFTIHRWATPRKDRNKINNNFLLYFSPLFPFIFVHTINRIRSFLVSLCFDWPKFHLFFRSLTWKKQIYLCLYKNVLHFCLPPSFTQTKRFQVERWSGKSTKETAINTVDCGWWPNNSETNIHETRWRMIAHCFRTKCWMKNVRLKWNYAVNFLKMRQCVISVNLNIQMCQFVILCCFLINLIICDAFFLIQFLTCLMFFNRIYCKWDCSFIIFSCQISFHWFLISDKSKHIWKYAGTKVEKNYFRFMKFTTKTKYQKILLLYQSNWTPFHLSFNKQNKNNIVETTTEKICSKRFIQLLIVWLK